jgi:general secretion pathway protein B
MSYILDALRRADAERERGAVPSIHAQQFGQLPNDDEPLRPPRRLLWAVVALVSVLVALLAWILLGRDATRLPASPPMAATTPAAPVAGAALPAVPPAASVAPAIPVATPPHAVPPSTPAADSRAATPIKPAHRTVRATPPAPVAKPAEPATPAPERAPAAAREPPETKVVAQRDLPADIRSGMPKITISGSTYSSEPSSRMLMIGGQIFHEGDPVVGGVVLRHVKPHAAVFAYRGYLYEVGF